MGKHRTDWHQAAVCAIKIDLRDYGHMLEYHPEYRLKYDYRIDLLVIKKLLDQPIPKNIARIFSRFNIIEVKGIGSSVTSDSYYKVNGYAGNLIDCTGERNQYSREDVSLTFISRSYPRKLVTVHSSQILSVFFPFSSELQQVDAHKMPKTGILALFSDAVQHSAQHGLNSNGKFSACTNVKSRLKNIQLAFIMYIKRCTQHRCS